MKKGLTVFLIIIACFAIEGVSAAVEVAPRISDREIIENLAEIKATLKSFEEQFKQIEKRFEQVDKRFEQVDKRFEQVDKRFEQVDKRFEQVDKRFEQVDKRFEQVDKRFEQVDKRFEELQINMRFLFGIVITMIIALFGYMVWDRRTIMKPLKTKLITLERELEIGREEGTKLGRLIRALRELSKEDQKVEKVLKEFHLL